MKLDGDGIIWNYLDRFMDRLLDKKHCDVIVAVLYIKCSENLLLIFFDFLASIQVRFLSYE